MERKIYIGSAVFVVLLSLALAFGVFLGYHLRPAGQVEVPLLVGGAHAPSDEVGRVSDPVNVEERASIRLSDRLERLSAGREDLIWATLAENESQFVFDFVKTLAEADPRSAAEKIWSVGDPQEASGLGVVVATTWAKSDPASAYEWLLSVKSRFEPNGFDSAFRFTVDMLASEDPRRAADIVSGMESSQVKDGLVQRVSRLLGRKDGAAGVEWVFSLANDSRSGISPQVVSESVNRALIGFSETDARAAARLARELMGEAMPISLVEKLAAQMAGVSTDEALSWINGFDDSVRRAEGLLSFARSANDAQRLDLVGRLATDVSLLPPYPEVLSAVFESLAESAAGDLESAIDQFPDEVAPLVREALERQKSWEVPSS